MLARAACLYAHRVTQFKLKEYGLSTADCPTVVIDDSVGGYGNVRCYRLVSLLRSPRQSRACLRSLAGAGSLEAKQHLEA